MIAKAPHRFLRALTNAGNVGRGRSSETSAGLQKWTHCCASELQRQQPWEFAALCADSSNVAAKIGAMKVAAGAAEHVRSPW